MRFRLAQNKIGKQDFLINIFLSVITIILFVINDHGEYNALLSVFIVFVNLLSLFKVRYNWYLLFIVVYIMYCNYSIVLFNYLMNSGDSYYLGFTDTPIGVLGLNILLLFQMVLQWSVPVTTKENVENPKALIVNNKYNPIVVAGIAIVLILIWVYGFTRPDLGERGETSPIYEYSFIFLIISLYYSGKNKFFINLNIILALAFVLQNFIFGGRTTGLQTLIVLALSLYVDKFTVKKIIIAGVPLFLLMYAIGLFRASIIYGFNLETVVNVFQTRHFTLSTAQSAYFTSMTFLDVADMSSWSDRLYLFRQWVLSMFVGGSFVHNSNLAVYTRSTWVHYGGGILPYFAWFYLGIFGILILGLYMRFLFKIINKSNAFSGGLIRCVAIYVCATTIRWYLYSPSQLFRGVLLLILSYGVAYVANEFMYKNVRKEGIQKKDSI